MSGHAAPRALLRVRANIRFGVLLGSVVLLARRSPSVGRICTRAKSVWSGLLGRLRLFWSGERGLPSQFVVVESHAEVFSVTVAVVVVQSKNARAVCELLRLRRPTAERRYRRLCHKQDGYCGEQQNNRLNTRLTSTRLVMSYAA